LLLDRPSIPGARGNVLVTPGGGKNDLMFAFWKDRRAVRKDGFRKRRAAAKKERARRAHEQKIDRPGEDVTHWIDRRS
jgi:hypothetical protein